MSPSTRRNRFNLTNTNRQDMMEPDNVETPKSNTDDQSNHCKAKISSITTGKWSSINPYRIFILLAIGFPGLNNGEFLLIIFYFCAISYLSFFIFHFPFLMFKYAICLRSLCYNRQAFVYNVENRFSMEGGFYQRI